MTSSSSKSKYRKTTKAQPNSADSSLVLSDQEFPSLGPRTKANHSRTTPNDQHNASGTPPTATITILKPKKRVAPITVATHSNRSVFGSPAFRSDNNLLNISSADDDGAIISRKLLKTHIDEISKDFENEPLPERGIHSILHGTHKLTSDGQKPIDTPIDLTKVERRNVIEKLICIHSAIIDLNLTTNFLTEIAYLLNLLNVDVTVMAVANHFEELPLSMAATVDFGGQLNEAIEPHLINRPSETVSMVTTGGVAARTELMLPVDILRNNINNCVYFSLGVLNKQKHILALLDITTIKVLLDNERLLEFNEYIKEFLLKTYSHKLKMESLKRTHDISFKPSLYGAGGMGRGADGNSTARIDGGEGVGGSIGNNINVFYQQENDTKDNFPSMKEFMAFRKQRDCFCNILR